MFYLLESKRVPHTVGVFCWALGTPGRCREAQCPQSRKEFFSFVTSRAGLSGAEFAGSSTHPETSVVTSNIGVLYYLIDVRAILGALLRQLKGWGGSSLACWRIDGVKTGGREQ